MGETLAEIRFAAGLLAQTWVERHEHWFARGAGEGACAGPFVKRTAELAVIAAQLIDGGYRSGRPLLERCWERFDKGAELVKLAATSPVVATIYVAFWRHGLRSPDLEHMLTRDLYATDDASVRLLSACALQACGLPAPWDLAGLLRDSWVGGMPPTWQVTPHEAYVATHVALFLAPTGQLPDGYRAYLRRAIPVWIALFARAGDLDLVGELIMTAHLLGDCVDPTEWRYLLDAQEPDGLVPFRLAWRGRAVPPEVRFHGNYHSTLVTVAACAMCCHA